MTFCRDERGAEAIDGINRRREKTGMTSSTSALIDESLASEEMINRISFTRISSFLSQADCRFWVGRVWGGRARVNAKIGAKVGNNREGSGVEGKDDQEWKYAKDTAKTARG